MAALTGIALLSPNLEGAAPSRTYTYSAGNVISPDEVTTNEDNVYTYLQTGVDTYKDLSIETADLAGSAVTNAKIGANAVTTDKVSDGTLVGDDLVNDTLDAEELDETDDYTWTGAHDFGGATIEIDNQADCSTVTGEALACWDSDNDLLYMGTGAAALAVGNYAVPALTLGTAAAEGAANTAVRTDATLPIFNDGSTPENHGTAATGTDAFATRRDHVHNNNGKTVFTAYQEGTVATIYAINGESNAADEIISVPAPYDGTANNLRRIGIAAGNYTATLRVNGTNTGLASAGTAAASSDTTSPIDINAGDLMEFTMTSNAGAASHHRASFELLSD